MNLLGWVMIWVASAIASAGIAARTGAKMPGFLFGLALGPVGLALSFLLDRADGHACPLCRELVHRGATVCGHCGRDLM